MFFPRKSFYTCVSIKYTAINPLAVAQTRPLAGDVSTGPQCSQVTVVGVQVHKGCRKGGYCQEVTQWAWNKEYSNDMF